MLFQGSDINQRKRIKVPKKKEEKQTQAGEETENLTPETEASEAAAAPGPEAELEASRLEAAQNRDLYLRAVADLDNYRKRAQREREDLAKYANENILRELVPVLDNLERAVEHARGEDPCSSSLMQGVEMTLSQFGRALEKFGVRPFSSLGEPFDPSRHEAMGQLESAEHAPNCVAQELQKGYMLNDRLLRPALVMVSKAPQ